MAVGVGAGIITASLAVWLTLQHSIVKEAKPAPTASAITLTKAIHATKAQPYLNSLGMRFVPLPGTRLLTCIHETRRQDYAAYAKAVPGVDDSWVSITRKGISVGAEESHPVVNVTWAEARDFCRWLSEKEGLRYRLPTDREWSIAIGIADREKPNSHPRC